MHRYTRFTKGVIETAAKDDTALPWTRGRRRTAFIYKRTANDKQRRAA